MPAPPEKEMPSNKIDDSGATETVATSEKTEDSKEMTEDEKTAKWL